MSSKTYDLHVSSLINTNGGVIYAKKGNVTDIRGFIPSRSFGVNDEKMMVIDRGVYIVKFEETRFPEFDDPDCQMSLNQELLFNSSMSLTINNTPFMGQLIVFSPSQIEVGAKLATLTFTKKDVIIPETPVKVKKEKNNV